MPRLSSTFVGRRRELTAFERAVDSARRGVPAVVLVGGDAGIGKSTLVAEGARWCGVELVVGRCVPVAGETIPLAPLSELVRNVRRSRPDALSGPSLAPLQAWAGSDPAVREGWRQGGCSARCWSSSDRSRATG